jgi:PPOX class probable F420-dependent enzyme
VGSGPHEVIEGVEVRVRLEGWARAVLERPRQFAVLATIRADGSAHQAVVWYDLRGDDLVVNSRPERAWPTNLRRDPRFSLLIEDAYEWLAIRGRAQWLDDPDQAREDIIGMARRYHAEDPARAERAVANFRTQSRESFLLHVEHVTEYRD